ncbi:MAG: EamA family transporter [Nocardioidaceae bacterium]
MADTHDTLPRPLLVALALGIVYVVWGSTYLAIRVMVEDMPPMLSAGGRFLFAAVLLGALLAARFGVRRLRVTRAELAGSALLGLLLPALGNGVVTVAEHRGAPSGIAALLVAALPLWVMVYRLASGDRPGRWTVAGVLLGFGGLAGLVLSTGVGGTVPIGASLLVVLATLAWSFGSWFQPRLRLPRDPFVTTVWEMLTGGAILAVAGLTMGERVSLSSYSAASWWAWGYLVVFGSVVAFSAYVWALGNAPISLVATYAYVNPVVAVFLGWLILAEPVTWPIAVGGGVVVTAVAVVVGAERPSLRRTPAPSTREPTAAPRTSTDEFAA